MNLKEILKMVIHNTVTALRHGQMQPIQPQGVPPMLRAPEKLERQFSTRSIHSE